MTPRERGAALLMTLMMLLMLGAGGSVAMHSALLQQRGATNLQLQRLSLLAAEQALMLATRQVHENAPWPVVDGQPATGLSAQLGSLDAAGLWAWLQDAGDWQSRVEGTQRMAWRIIPEGEAMIGGAGADIYRLQALGISGNSRSLLEVQHARIRQ